jgi:hypothetical protein
MGRSDGDDGATTHMSANAAERVGDFGKFRHRMVWPCDRSHRGSSLLSGQSVLNGRPMPLHS